MPYPYDIIRLVASARLSSKLDVEPKKLTNAVLDGYVEGLRAPGPILLDQSAAWFRTLVTHLADTSQEFWEELDNLQDVRTPAKVKRALHQSLPEDAAIRRFVSRRRGGGSLGRPRFLVFADWRGGTIVREAKAIVPSAWIWAHSKSPLATDFSNWRTAHIARPTRPCRPWQSTYCDAWHQTLESSI